MFSYYMYVVSEVGCVNHVCILHGLHSGMRQSCLYITWCQQWDAPIMFVYYMALSRVRQSCLYVIWCQKWDASITFVIYIVSNRRRQSCLYISWCQKWDASMFVCYMVSEVGCVSHVCIYYMVLEVSSINHVFILRSVRSGMRQSCLYIM